MKLPTGKTVLLQLQNRHDFGLACFVLSATS